VARTNFEWSIYAFMFAKSGDWDTEDWDTENTNPAPESLGGFLKKRHRRGDLSKGEALDLVRKSSETGGTSRRGDLQSPFGWFGGVEFMEISEEYP
jgi:hypothetical protein